MDAKLPQGTLEKLWRDRANWWGPFYACKDDPRHIVPKRIRVFGWTLNTAHRGAWVQLVVNIALTVGSIVCLKAYGNPGWIGPALAVLTIITVLECRRQASPKRFEESA